MFDTYDGGELYFPPGLRDEKNKSWWYVELSLNLTWFLIKVEIYGSGHEYPVRRTLLFSTIDHVVDFTSDNNVNILEIYLCTPGYVNGSGEWKMDLLKKVVRGKCNDEKHPDIISIYRTNDGLDYYDPQKIDTSEIELQCIFQMN